MNLYCFVMALPPSLWFAHIYLQQILAISTLYTETYLESSSHTSSLILCLFQGPLLSLLSSSLSLLGAFSLFLAQSCPSVSALKLHFLHLRQLLLLSTYSSTTPLSLLKKANHDLEIAWYCRMLTLLHVMHLHCHQSLHDNLKHRPKVPLCPIAQ